MNRLTLEDYNNMELKRSITVMYVYGRKPVTIANRETVEEARRRELAEIQSAKQEVYRQTHAARLCCDLCYKVIGAVYDNDLNGSRFYCLDCVS